MKKSTMAVATLLTALSAIPASTVAFADDAANANQQQMAPCSGSCKASCQGANDSSDDCSGN